MCLLDSSRGFLEPRCRIRYGQKSDLPHLAMISPALRVLGVSSRGSDLKPKPLALDLTLLDSGWETFLGSQKSLFSSSQRGIRTPSVFLSHGQIRVFLGGVCQRKLGSQRARTNRQLTQSDSRLAGQEELWLCRGDYNSP